MNGTGRRPKRPRGAPSGLGPAVGGTYPFAGTGPARDK
jgi:hypothetical protein